MNEAGGQTDHDRRTEARGEELDRRLVFFETTDESRFGAPII